METFDTDPRNPIHEPLHEQTTPDYVRCLTCGEFFHKDDHDKPIPIDNSITDWNDIEECGYCSTHSICCGANIINGDICADCGEHCK